MAKGQTARVRSRYRDLPELKPVKVETLVDMTEGKILGRVVAGTFLPAGDEGCPTNPLECESPACWRPWPPGSDLDALPAPARFRVDDGG